LSVFGAYWTDLIDFELTLESVVMMPYSYESSRVLLTEVN